MCFFGDFSSPLFVICIVWGGLSGRNLFQLCSCTKVEGRVGWLYIMDGDHIRGMNIILLE